ncbi:MAG: Phosphotransferase enzyme family protein [Methanosaeta sp. PtaU1.Bin112]|nr:MAG: Phosphotransferase enzyme family protein [Methanosaeta sp. PtaU1.Bin112]
MAKEKRVGSLVPGDAFRKWLMDVLSEKINDRNCPIKVYKIKPSSHTVCRYEFPNQGFSVVAKFYAESIGWKKNYDPVHALEKEFNTLKRLENIIDIPRPLAINEDFHCALLTEYVDGISLYKCMQRDDGLYDKLTAIAGVQRRLHDQTRSDYRKDRVFAKFHRVLDQLGMDPLTRLKYNHLLGEWWYSPLLDRPFGCMVHGDANPMNYLFKNNKVIVLDLESSKKHAHFIHDLGLIAAELKHYFAIHRGDGNMAEPFIGHYLWRYSHNEPEFYAITRVLPFFMSLGFLRMARLNMAPEHKAYILREAIACLENGLCSQRTKYG